MRRILKLQSWERVGQETAHFLQGQKLVYEKGDWVDFERKECWRVHLSSLQRDIARLSKNWVDFPTNPFTILEHRDQVIVVFMSLRNVVCRIFKLLSCERVGRVWSERTEKVDLSSLRGHSAFCPILNCYIRLTVRRFGCAFLQLPTYEQQFYLFYFNLFCFKSPNFVIE